MARLSLETLDDFPLVKPGDNLCDLICASLQAGGQGLKDGDILVLAQKIVSKAEGRYRTLSDIVPGKDARALAIETDKDPRLVQAILDESTEVVRKRKGVLIVRHRRGWVMAQAGIDQSNIEGGDAGRILLLPEDPDISALNLKEALESRLGVALAVVIADSFGRPFRNGTTGIAVGAAGLESFIDKRGETDLFGKALMVSTIAHADEIASAASILMGQADEGTPAVVVSGLAKSEHVAASALIRPIEEDMFR